MPANPRLDIVAWVLAALLALFVAYTDLHSDEIPIVAALVLISALVLALVRPVHAWRWGLLMGLTILAAEVYSYYAVAPRAGLKTISSFAVLMAIVTVIGTIGAYVGVGVRKLGALVVSR